ncbi:MAG: hypothetical protein E7662_07120 [Ruminococcaceae bacterium]|nr:hypothetical protein [Oscillospiraceae bacterium]
MQNDLIRMISRISLITQLGLSLVTPPLLLLLGALWLQNRFGIGDWILLCAILAGIISGGYAAYNLIRAELHREKYRKSASSDTKGKQ